MSWIRVVAPDQGDELWRRLYERVRRPDGGVDNILQAHSLRPHTLEGHMALYKAVLHHSRNQLSDDLLETLGIYVSILNRCEYCVAHHTAGLAMVIGDADQAQAIRKALGSDDLRRFDARRRGALRYAAKLTRDPGRMVADDIDALRRVGFSDGEVLEINQVSAYFAYANRTVVGLGVNADGEVLGAAPRDKSDSSSWGHA